MMDLIEAKVLVIAGFASGPGAAIADADERDDRLYELLAHVELLYDDEAPVEPAAASEGSGRARPASVAGGGRVNWTAIVAAARRAPGEPQRVVMGTAGAAKTSATRLREKFGDLDVWVDGLEVVVSVEAA